MPRTIRYVLNEANPNKIPDGLHVVKVGEALALLARSVSGAVASHILTLPNDSKAIVVHSAYVTAGTLTGYMTPVARGAAVTTGQVGITPTGDILFATADAVTAAEVIYSAMEGDVTTEEVAVNSSGVASPLQNKLAITLISANLTVGASAGTKTVVARGSAPSAGQAAIAVNGTLKFNATDAGASGGKATVTYIAKPGTGGASLSLAARLDQTATF